jgi:hydroxyacylglutathione hydrolase
MQICEKLHGFFWNSPQANNCNTYLIDDGVRVLVDPGHAAFFDHVRLGLNALRIDLADIDLVVCTHAHPDHIEAVRFFKTLPARVAMHPDEWRMVKEMGPYVRNAMGVDIEDLTPDLFLSEGSLKVRGLGLDVYHTPGHAPGAICIHWPEAEALFTGDLIFAGGLGRTDLPGGSGPQLKESIRSMAAINGVSHLLPGHGPALKGAEAVQRNFSRVEQAWFGYL